ncbi:hypothetical protein GQ53DRAFT_744944 [Thozetella sp. PMI_491]|nr:hypothetical protein GQ53DRAFT_744944 [Thozetella sp. PMI_491]
MAAAPGLPEMAGLLVFVGRVGLFLCPRAGLGLLNVHGRASVSHRRLDDDDQEDHQGEERAGRNEEDLEAGEATVGGLGRWSAEAVCRQMGDAERQRRLEDAVAGVDHRGGFGQGAHGEGERVEMLGSLLVGDRGASAGEKRALHGKCTHWEKGECLAAR